MPEIEAPTTGVHFHPLQGPMPQVPPEVMQWQFEHNKKIAAETLEMMTTTLDNAARSYRWVTNMNVVMFAVGIAMFVAAGIVGLFIETDSVGPVLLGGLGAATFVGLFLTGAIAKTQDALSNLVQVHIAFMQWFSQMGIWSTVAQQSPTEASAAMQQRSAETIELLQRYTESPPKSKG